ncbi:MAG: ribosome biogenesis GTPase YlqF [Oscillospiraceae bacterium]|nr:ribosome biogenesis GTPase YlqF [Oscillospiraceae bacterium]
MNNNNDNTDFNIHWYPGHMAKTRRMIEENLKLVDVLAEITDARIPEAGRNPVLNEIAQNKPRILLLNKCDYADSSITKSWIDYYAKNGLTAVACDARSGRGLKNIVPLLEKTAGPRKYAGAVRVMVAGIPNAGKSSFINRIAGGRKTAVGDRPGVTRGKQWIAVGKTIELLDLPGILPPKLDNRETALMLAYTGAVRDEVMDSVALAYSLAGFLKEHHPEKLNERYKLISMNSDILISVAKVRGMVVKGGNPDIERAASALLDEFRGGKIGKITIQSPV